MKSLLNAFSIVAALPLAAFCACLCLMAQGPLLGEDGPAAGTPPPSPTGFKVDFSAADPASKGKIPKNWNYKGKFGTPSADFYVVKDAEGVNLLKMESAKGSGSILIDLSGKVDLNKLPIMRWRWKVTKLPAGADGRDSKKDDQAIGVYVGFGKIARQSVAYRWETETPVGVDGSATYGAGMVSVKWYCVRNAGDGLDKWMVEERNVAEDLKAAFGKIPDYTVLSVSCNSQYTGGDSEAWLDYVEFLPAGTASIGRTDAALLK